MGTEAGIFVSNARTGFRGSTFPVVLAAAQAGAPWACSDIWLQFAPAVAGFLSARGSIEPDDLTSEVFLTVFDRLAEFEGTESEFRSFLFTIAYRRLVDELRRRARRGTQLEWQDESDPRHADSAEHEALDRIADADTRALLDDLAPDQRDVLVMRIFGDLTIDQVAEILGKRPGAVKALQRRGLEALRKKIHRTRTPGRPSNDSES